MKLENLFVGDNMDKNCKNCKSFDYCPIAEFEAAIHCDISNWHCSDYEHKKKTVKLCAYLKEDDGCHELIWHTHMNLNIDRYTRVPSEDKEVEI